MPITPPPDIMHVAGRWGYIVIQLEKQHIFPAEIPYIFVVVNHNTKVFLNPPP